MRLMLIAALTATMSAQTLVDNTARTVIGSFDASGALYSKPLVVVGSDPSGVCPVNNAMVLVSTNGKIFACVGGTWTVSSSGGGGGGGGSFDAITTGINTTSTMTLGSGSTLTYTGTGVVNASQFRGNTVVADADIAATLARDAEVAAAYQPLDTDLTTIAAMAPARGALIRRGAAAWETVALGALGRVVKSDGTDAVWGQVAYGELTGVPASFTPSTHATTHQHLGTDEIATATPGANAIPKAGAGGTLAAGWVPDLSSTYVPAGRTVATTSPISGGGALSSNITLSIPGLSTIGTSNYLVGVNAAGDAWEYKQLNAGSGVNITPGAGSITISATGGGGPGNGSYTQSFTTQTSVVLTHALGTKNVLVSCYDGSDNYIEWNTLVTTSTSAATVTFTGSQTGRCTVTIGGSGAKYSTTFTSQTTVTVTGVTHNIGSPDIHVQCRDAGSPRQIVEPNTVTVNDSTYDVVITFAVAQSGRCTLL